jgi:hypothetical protein
MKTFFINSKKAVVQLHNKHFSGELTEVEKLAEILGQYGNIIKYKISREDDITNIFFDLLEPADFFLKKSTITQQDVQDQNKIKKIEDPDTGESYELTNNRQMTTIDNQPAIEVIKDGQPVTKVIKPTTKPVIY